MANKKMSTSNTKAQILDAYNAISKELQSKNEENPKIGQQRKADNITVRKAENKSREGIIEEISSFKTIFISSLEKVQSRLIEEKNSFETIQNAIKIEKKNLEDLYGISTNTDSLAAILITQKDIIETFEEERNRRKEEWKLERETYESSVKDHKQNNEKARKREEEEYKYKLDIERRNEKDKYNSSVAEQQKTLLEQKLKLDKEFKAREDILKEQESEFKALKTEVASHPVDLEKAVENAKTLLSQALKLEFKYKNDLSSQEAEGLIKLKDLEIASLKTKIQEMESIVKSSNSKADLSEKTVKDIALKAIENSKQIHVVEKERDGRE